MRQELGGDTLPRVTDRYLDVRIDPLECDLNLAASRGELHGVREKVPHHLLQAGRIAGNGTGFGIEKRLEPCPFGNRRRSYDLDCLLDHWDEVHRSDF